MHKIYLAAGDKVLDEVGVWVATRYGALEELRDELVPIEVEGITPDMPPFGCYWMLPCGRLVDIRATHE